MENTSKDQLREVSNETAQRIVRAIRRRFNNTTAAYKLSREDFDLIVDAMVKNARMPLY